jgi:hypothetical protein
VSVSCYYVCVEVAYTHTHIHVYMYKTDCTRISYACVCVQEYIHGHMCTHMHVIAGGRVWRRMTTSY